MANQLFYTPWKNRGFSQQQGFSLLELLLVLGALAMMLATVSVMLGMFSFENLARKEQALLSATIAGLATYKDESAPKAPTVKELLKAGVLVDAQVEDGRWTSTSRTPIEIHRSGDFLSIGYSGVHGRYCELLIGEMLGAAPRAFTSIMVNGKEVLNGPVEVVNQECLRHGDTRRGVGPNQVRFVLSNRPEDAPSTSDKPAVKNKRWGTSEEI